MPFKAYTPFELGEIAFKQGHPISSNPFTQSHKGLQTYCPDYNQWELGYLVAKCKALEETRARAST